MSGYAYVIEVWPGTLDASGKAVLHRYAAMTTSRGKALKLARDTLPAEWKIEAPNRPPYDEAVVAKHGLEPGDLRRIK